MIRKYHNHSLHTSPWRHKKSHRTLTANRHQEEILNKVTSSLSLSLFGIKMIAKLEGPKVLYNKTMTKHRTPTNNGSNNK